MKQSDSSNSSNDDPAIELLCQLLRQRSITPDDAGCQNMLAERLAKIGFKNETMVFGDVTNLWSRKGDQSPLFCFAGHTDVVPPGDTAAWQSDPFEPTFANGQIYARGAADMKASLAAFTVAAERFAASHPDHKGSIAFLITSDEEGDARDGTLKVIETLQQRSEQIDWCLVGEPSSQDTLGDTIRVGRRGSLSGMLKVHGVQGHVAYPNLADNPISRFAPVLAELCATEWDQGNDLFPPTSFQVVNISSGVGAPNVTPAELDAQFNFRYSTEWNHHELQEKTREILDGHGLDYELDWRLSGEPFLTEAGVLTKSITRAVKSVTGIEAELSTGGGTSDGRFISPAGVDVVELGPINETIHKVNECVAIDDVRLLTDIYYRTLELLLTN